MTAENRIPATRTNWIVLLITAVSALTIDLWSKSAVFSWVQSQPDQRVTFLPGRFEFRAAYNDAGIWSIGHGNENSNAILATIGVGIIGLVAWWAWSMLATCGRFTAFLLGLVLGGAIGNLYDRFAFQGVRDFIQVYLWGGYQYPTFNLADSFMVCSVIIIAVMSFLPESTSQPKPVPQKV